MNVFMGKYVFSSLNHSSSSLKNGENITYLLSFGLFQDWNEILHLDGLELKPSCDELWTEVHSQQCFGQAVDFGLHVSAARTYQQGILWLRVSC